jgi:HKD family nuclease
METVFLDNRSRAFESAIRESLDAADRADIAVAYSTPEGVDRLSDGLAHLGERGGRARLLTGLDDFITDLDGVDRFSSLPGTECRVFLPTAVGDRARFHPKLYVFEGSEESNVIVGSANLTGAGLETNHEAGLWLRASPDEPLLKAVGDSFRFLWESPRAVLLTDPLRREYERARSARREAIAEVTELEAYRRWRDTVRGSVARSLTRPGSRKWLMITSPRNLAICLAMNRWGDERWERIAQVQPGDGIVFYITGEYTLGAMAIAVGPARLSHERPWPDRPYPYQMDIQFLTVADPRPSIRPFIRELDLFGHTEAGWGQRLQTTLRALSDADFRVLSTAMGSPVWIVQEQG